ncbi:MAG TPA: nitrilase, partial [Alphaproteobacteria bacterium]|nr:nitrilase [Alphaproteobacteria bacterium]
MTDLSLALWATNVAPRLNGLPAWLARIEGKLIEARRAGADLLVMPEYACVQWLSFAPKGIGLAQEIGWMAGLGTEAVEGLKPLVARHGVALLAGTMPVSH